MIGREVRMECDTEQAALRAEVHVEIEHRLHGAVGNPLHPAGGLFEHEDVVGAEKRDRGRSHQAGDNGPDREVRGEHFGRRLGPDATAR